TALNPFNGEKLPIWIANYIVMDYGTGAIMSVPAHDERDFEFAKKYGLEVRCVIQPKDANDDAAHVADAGRERDHARELPFISEEGVVINSGEFTGLSCLEAQ